MDLSFSKNSVDPEIVLSFMSGAVTGLDVSSVYNIFASSAGNCKLTLISSIYIYIHHTFISAIRVNNIINQDILSQRIFNTNVTSLKWFPSVVSNIKMNF